MIGEAGTLGLENLPANTAEGERTEGNRAIWHDSGLKWPCVFYLWQIKLVSTHDCRDAQLEITCRSNIELSDGAVIGSGSAGKAPTQASLGQGGSFLGKLSARDRLHKSSSSQGYRNNQGRAYRRF